MDTTEARLARLERSLSRWRRLAKLCLVGAVCLPFMGQAKPKPAVLVVDHLTVRDREGTPRLVISPQGEISRLKKQNPRARRAPVQHTDYSVDSVNVYDDFQPLREWDLRSQ